MKNRHSELAQQAQNAQQSDDPEKAKITEQLEEIKTAIGLLKAAGEILS